MIINIHPDELIRRDAMQPIIRPGTRIYPRVNTPDACKFGFLSEMVELLNTQYPLTIDHIGKSDDGWVVYHIQEEKGRWNWSTMMFSLSPPAPDFTIS
jgi:hypothetical protein